MQLGTVGWHKKIAHRPHHGFHWRENVQEGEIKEDVAHPSLLPPAVGQVKKYVGLSNIWINILRKA